MATIAHGTPEVTREEVNYLNVEHGWKSWLFTTDHKRIAILYLISITLMFFVGGAMAVMFRINLLERGHEQRRFHLLGHLLAESFFHKLPGSPAGSCPIHPAC